VPSWERQAIKLSIRQESYCTCNAMSHTHSHAHTHTHMSRMIVKPGYHRFAKRITAVAQHNTIIFHMYVYQIPEFQQIFYPSLVTEKRLHVCMCTCHISGSVGVLVLKRFKFGPTTPTHTQYFGGSL
jgi:hypothetical protein